MERHFLDSRAVKNSEMGSAQRHTSGIPLEQQAIRDRCLHPTGVFIEFKKEETEQSIPSRFEALVRKYPDRLAIKTKNQQLTYDELNKAANQVASALLAECGEAQEPVALLVEQGLQVVAAILGVLKAGKFYVPLDPSYPSGRTNYMLENSQARVIVTNQRNLSLAKQLSDHGCLLLNIDALGAAPSCENPKLPILPEDSAYIIYTSGSTGQPKGVVENHRNVLHQSLRLNNVLHMTAEDRQTLLRSTSFVGSVKDIFGALLNGAGLYPFDIKEEGLSGFAAWLGQEEITMYRSVVTVFRHFAATLTGAEEFPQLRLIYVGGEALYAADIDLYKAHFSPDCVFVNGLGLTESGSVRYFFRDKRTQITTTNVPVGYSVGDMEILLLDKEGAEVGYNCIGEIAIRSRYLCKGYWRDPELTQAAFPAEADRGGRRTYRTGDLGRMLKDGCLIHLGREDFQVKVRGNRVEIAEIEVALLNLEDIKEVAVTDRADSRVDQSLVAYFVPARKPAPNVGELRNSLMKKLPEYMVPSRLIMLDALPLLPNGKVDRRALPEPGNSRPDLGNAFVAPATPVEVLLAQIWAEVLDLDQVGIHDSFLDLGGNSLLASQVISRVIKTFTVDLSLRVLFDAPTIADMALAIVQSRVGEVNEVEVDRMLRELEYLP